MWGLDAARGGCGAIVRVGAVAGHWDSNPSVGRDRSRRCQTADWIAHPDTVRLSAVTRRQPKRLLVCRTDKVCLELGRLRPRVHRVEDAVQIGTRHDPALGLHASGQIGP